MKPYVYICKHKGCGCLWRDNGNGTMSLFNGLQESCPLCEFLSIDKLKPLYEESKLHDVNALLLDALKAQLDIQDKKDVNRAYRLAEKALKAAQET